MMRSTCQPSTLSCTRRPQMDVIVEQVVAGCGEGNRRTGLLSLSQPLNAFGQAAMSFSCWLTFSRTLSIASTMMLLAFDVVREDKAPLNREDEVPMTKLGASAPRPYCPYS